MLATGEDSTCTREAWSAFGANATCCYSSCAALGRCETGPSVWTNGTAHCGWCVNTAPIIDPSTPHAAAAAATVLELSARYCLERRLPGMGHGGGA